MRGHTLVELTFVLALLGVTATAWAPTARRLHDRAAVHAAREAVVALLAEARLAAVELGDARVRITGTPWSAEAIAGGATLRTVALTSDFGVTLALGGTDTNVELRYDALGLGRMASRTIVFRRADETAALVVSTYGRVRRR